jgi:hypothetical protein
MIQCRNLIKISEKDKIVGYKFIYILKNVALKI